MAQGNQPAVGGIGGTPAYGSGDSANLADILERVLDKGLVIAGDIRVNLLDIELLTVKLRLVIASLETAREVGMDWWERDPWFTGADAGSDSASGDRELERENRELRRRVAELESSADAGKGRKSVKARGRQRELESDEHESAER